MFNTWKTLLALVAAGTVLVQQGTVSAGTISMNFTGRLSNFDTPVLLHVEFGDSSSGVAGVNGNDVWNDLVLYGDQETRGEVGPFRVTGSLGESAVLTVRSQGTWSKTAQGTRIVPAEDPSGDMMDGWISTGDSQPCTATVSELADDFPVYDVYAYVGDSDGGKPGSMTLSSSPMAASPIGMVTYTTRLFDGTFVKAAEGNTADYVVFPGVTGDSFTITGGGIGTGLHGLEIVGVPEPSTFVLAILAALGLGLYGWRRCMR